MANLLDESGPIMEEGRDVNVINKKIPVTVGVGSKIFEVLLWVLLIIPGVVFLVKKIQAKNYFQKLEQQLQHDASTIDNYLEQRVIILENAASLVKKAVDLDKSTFSEIAKARSGNVGDLNEKGQAVENATKQLNVAIEAYPELRAHESIANAMQQNSYLQREITAAREVYNDRISQWNRDVFSWPTKQIVAAKEGYTTRIPYAVSSEMKAKARSNFFN
ncbi:MAG: LemA family protein [Bacilli bacterium]|nr:LemA family protein [Bacilli bacterium]